jgi:hypothetical protein
MAKDVLSKLNDDYNKTKDNDEPLMAEMRSNILLYIGDHYNRLRKFMSENLRDHYRSGVEDQNRIRITKNHTRKICNEYINNILTYAPDVGIFPYNEDEIQDVKNAELNRAVWSDIKEKHKFEEKKAEWVKHFVVMGEVYVCIKWDASKGPVIGQKPMVSETGEPVVNAMGMPIMEDVYQGDFEFTTHFPYNTYIINGKSYEDSEGVIFEELVDLEELKLAFPKFAEKFEESKDNIYTVFDGVTAKYRDLKGKQLIRYHYYRPSSKYPQGRYFICNDTLILAEDDLPFGIFPIAKAHFDEIIGTPRARSIVKVIRPYQAEINRCGSSIVLNQLTHGEDKVYVAMGSKFQPKNQFHGVRVFEYTGQPPITEQGQVGTQYFQYLMDQITEMYQVAGVQEDKEQKITQVDPFALLYTSMRSKKYFVIYAEKFERFLKEICKITMELAKQYYTENDQRLIRILGKNEQVNISEFKSSEPLSYQIRLDNVSDDAETRLGKQMALNTALQYVGGDLTAEEKAALFQSSPYLTKSEFLSEVTTSINNAKNIILALDRGEVPQPTRYENHQYVIGKLTNRINQPSFKYLDPAIQQNYFDVMKEHEKIIADIEAEKKALQSDVIPADGPEATVNLNFTDPATGSSKRMKLPVSSIMWLEERLRTQGLQQQAMPANPGVQADIAQQMAMSQPQPQQMPILPQM